MFGSRTKVEFTVEILFVLDQIKIVLFKNHELLEFEKVANVQ